jgi:HSP20 family protein
MNEQDQSVEERLEEVRRRARDLRERPDAATSSRENEVVDGRQAGGRRGPRVTAWRPAGRAGYGSQRDMARYQHGSGVDPSPTWSPRAEVFRRRDALIVRLELPGMDPKDVEVHTEGQMLVVEGERPDDRPEGDERFGRDRWGYGAFRREIALPRPVDASDLKGRFRNGVLEVAVPEPDREERRKRIKIEA